MSQAHCTACAGKLLPPFPQQGSVLFVSGAAELGQQSQGCSSPHLSETVCREQAVSAVEQSTRRQGNRCITGNKWRCVPGPNPDSSVSCWSAQPALQLPSALLHKGSVSRIPLVMRIPSIF